MSENLPATTGSTEIGELLKDGFNIFLKSENLIPLLVGSLIATVGMMFSLGLLMGPFFYGLYKIGLTAAQGGKPTIEMVFDGFKGKFGPTFVAGLIWMVCGMLSIVLVGIVGFFLTCFMLHEIATRDLGAVDAAKGSANLVKNHIGEVLIVAVVLGVIGMVLGMTGIGGLVSTPFSVLVFSMLYVRLSGNAQPSAL